MSDAGIRPVDDALLGPPAGTLANPTVLLFAAALLGAAASSLAYATGAWPPAATVAANAACLYALYTVMHEAAHRIAHHRRQVNEWLGRISAALQGGSFQSYRLLHLQHHAHTNDLARDPDRVLGHRPSWALPLWLALRVVNEYTWARRAGLWRDPDTLREHRFTLAVQLGVAAALAATLGLQALVVLWVAPFALSGLVIYVVFAWLVHAPHASCHPLENTRNVGGIGARLLTLNQSLHHVHHVWMTMPWFRYPRARSALRRALDAHDRLPSRV